MGAWFAIALDWLLVVATFFDGFSATWSFRLQQILQVEILLGDQVQNMLVRDFRGFDGSSGPIE
jgi:hypothetical protein